MSYRCYVDIEDPIKKPLPINSKYQSWKPNHKNPYPNTFTQAPAPSHQIMVHYNGKPQLQTLSPYQGPQMFPVRETLPNPNNSYERKNCIAYPTTHSIPGPFLRSYIDLPYKSSMY